MNEETSELFGADYKSELEKNGAIAFVPHGNSMWPILKNRKQTVVVIKKTDRLSRFDVALYERNGKEKTFVLHRVMKSADGGYIICGDSQFVLERVEEDAVFGVMSGYYKGKTFIPVTDEKYIRRVEKWYKRKTIRKIRLKFFYFRVRIKCLVARVFKRKKKD